MPVFSISDSVGSSVSLRWSKAVQRKYPRFYSDATVAVRSLYDDVERLGSKGKFSFKAYLDKAGQIWIKKRGIFNKKDEKIATETWSVSEQLFTLWTNLRRKSFNDL